MSEPTSGGPRTGTGSLWGNGGSPSASLAPGARGPGWRRRAAAVNRDARHAGDNDVEIFGKLPLLAYEVSLGETSQLHCLEQACGFALVEVGECRDATQGAGFADLFACFDARRQRNMALTLLLTQPLLEKLFVLTVVRMKIVDMCFN